MNHFKKIRTRNSSGFTLIEIIIAIGILAAMTVSMAEITDNIISSKDRSGKRAEARHSTSIALAKITDDVRMAFIADKKFQGQDSFYLTGFKANKTSLNFSTLSQIHYIKNNRDTNQVQVGYSLRKNDSGYYDLVRRQTDYLVDDLEQGGREFVLIKDVKDLEFEYYDSNKKDWKEEWDTESISFAGRLPQTVKIKITILGEKISEDEGDRNEFYYELMVPVEMYADKISF